MLKLRLLLNLHPRKWNKYLLGKLKHYILHQLNRRTGFISWEFKRKTTFKKSRIGQIILNQSSRGVWKCYVMFIGRFGVATKGSKTFPYTARRFHSVIPLGRLYLVKHLQ